MRMGECCLNYTSHNICNAKYNSSRIILQTLIFDWEDVKKRGMGMNDELAFLSSGMKAVMNRVQPLLLQMRIDLGG